MANDLLKNVSSAAGCDQEKYFGRRQTLSKEKGEEGETGGIDAVLEVQRAGGHCWFGWCMRNGRA
jgi:hypothetical protein